MDAPLLFPPCAGPVSECCAPTRCVVREKWGRSGFGSAVHGMLTHSLVPTASFGQLVPGMPPGVLQLDDSFFWYRCSPSQGLDCYFRPIRSCAQLLGVPMPDCTAEELRAAQGSEPIEPRVSLTASPGTIGRARAALRGVWQLNEQTAAIMRKRAQDSRGIGASSAAAAPYITVHLRRGDAKADGRLNWERVDTSLHAMATRVRAVVENSTLRPLEKLRVHVMSDDANAASQFFRMLRLPPGARVAVPALPPELTTGFKTCQSPMRFGWGNCNCSGPPPKMTSTKPADIAWLSRCVLEGTRNVISGLGGGSRLTQA